MISIREEYMGIFDFLENHKEIYLYQIPSIVFGKSEENTEKIYHELLKKGILDAEIELENRKNEVYYSTTYQNSCNNFDISEIFQNSAQFQYQDPYLYSYLANGGYKPNNELILPKRKMTMTIDSRNQTKNINQGLNPLYSTNTLKVNNKYKTKENNKAKNIKKKK